jgi:ribosomal protein L37AE/L43A
MDQDPADVIGDPDVARAFNAAVENHTRQVARAIDIQLQRAKTEGCPQCKSGTHPEAMMIHQLPAVVIKDKEGSRVATRTIVYCMRCADQIHERIRNGFYDLQIAP